MGCRMTVVRLPNQELWIHSPLAPTPELQPKLESLGTVAHVIAPNRMHHLYLECFCEHYSNAQSYAPPGHRKKLLRLYPSFTLDHELGEQPPTCWQGVFEQQLIAGLPGFQEVVFLHKPSGTLIVTDALYALDRVQPTFLRSALRALPINSPRGLFAERLIPMIKDEELLASSLQKIMQWDFDSIVMAHGGNIQEEGKAAFVRAYQRYLG